MKPPFHKSFLCGVVCCAILALFAAGSAYITTPVAVLGLFQAASAGMIVVIVFLSVFSVLPKE